MSPRHSPQTIQESLPMNPPLKTQLNRRDFLRSSTAALAAIGLPAIIPASAFGAGNKITIGCIGVGGMGTGNMKIFLGLPECRVVAVCDTYEDRRQKAKEPGGRAVRRQGLRHVSPTIAS